MSKAHIVGSMQLPDDDSDSSESEEEVELFEKPIVPEDTEKEPLAFEVSLPAAKIKPNGLLGAMTAALADIEGSRNESGNTADQNTEPEATPEPLPDAFGIVYKPLKKKTENQNVKAMSFEDEKEFERELQLANFGIGSSGAATSANNHNEEDDDDEFAIDATATDAPELSHILSRVASQQQQTETIAAAESVPVPVNDFNNQVWAASTSSATAVSEEEVSGASFLRNSRSALADIKSAYSEGRGDVEVRLLNDDRSNNSASNGNGVTATEVIPLHQLKDITVIEEGDEDEEEEEEEREELQKAAEARQEEELAVQWSSIGHESNEGEGQDEVGEVPSAMEMEFDAVAAGMNAGSGAGNGASAPAPAASTPTALSPVSYQECLLHLTGTSNLSQYEPLITVEDSGTTDQKGGLGGLGGLLFGSGNARLAFGSSAELTKEAQKLPFLLAQVDYTPSDSVHYRVLCTIYQSLCQYKNSSSSSISQQLVPPPASTSSLWEDIGFQGQDPRTDLNRAMKMLAVLQMLHFLESYPALARQCHVISESYIPNRTASTASLRADPTKDVSWPFMCVSIMFTKEALQAFRSGFLNAKCNKHGTILEILHDFHHALFQQFYRYDGCMLRMSRCFSV